MMSRFTRIMGKRINGHSAQSGFDRVCVCVRNSGYTAGELL